MVGTWKFITLFFLLCVHLKFCIMKKKNNCEHQKAQIRCCKYCQFYPVFTSLSSLLFFLTFSANRTQILFVVVMCQLQCRSSDATTIFLCRACPNRHVWIECWFSKKNTWCESLLLAYCLGSTDYFPTFLSFNFLICERIIITLLLTSWVIQRIKWDLHMYS